MEMGVGMGSGLGPGTESDGHGVREGAEMASGMRWDGMGVGME